MRLDVIVSSIHPPTHPPIYACARRLPLQAREAVLVGLGGLQALHEAVEVRGRLLVVPLLHLLMGCVSRVVSPSPMRLSNMSTNYASVMRKTDK